MSSRYFTFVQTNDVSSVLNDEQLDSFLPKIIFMEDESKEFLTTPFEQQTYEENRVPEDESFVVYPKNENGLTLGEDYSTLLFVSKSKNYVFHKDIPSPELSFSLNENNSPVLSWNRSFEIKTKIYRTEKYSIADGVIPSDFILIGEKDSTSVPGGTNSFVDEVMNIEEGTGVNYLIQNKNGTSNIISVINQEN